MLNDIKKVLGYNNNQFDDILNMDIMAVKMELIQLGIVSSKIVETDALIYRAIKEGVCSMDESYEYREQCANAYALIKDQLRHDINYITED